MQEEALTAIAKAVAKKLAYLYIDTGAMYRAIAWAALQKGVAADDTEALTDLAANCQICLADTPSGYKVYCDDTDISEAIRTPEVSAFASPVSAVAGVREYLVEQQQRCLLYTSYWRVDQSCGCTRIKTLA